MANFDVELDIAQLIMTSTSNYFTINNTFGSEMPTDPDNCVVVTFSPRSFSPTHTMGNNSQPVWYNPSVIIMLRHCDTSVLLEWANEIRKTVVGKTNLILNGNRYIYINQMGDLQYIGKDMQRRNRCTLNLQIQVDPAL